MASETYAFQTHAFYAVIDPEERKTPHWQLAVQSNDRNLLGTGRMERSIRSWYLAMEFDAWIEPSSSAAAAFAALQEASRTGSPGVLIPSHDGSTLPAGTTVTVLVFEMVPVWGGAAGYRGRLVFGKVES